MQTVLVSEHDNARTIDCSRMPIPARLNMALVALVSLAAMGLLFLASRVSSWYGLLGVGVVFSYVMLTDYALLHEGTHNTLHPARRGNYWLGFIAGVWFPAPFSLVHYAHRSHHRFNRTDAEMFDMYYPTDNRVLKCLQWYSILCGFFWPLVPLGALLITFTPGILRTRLLSDASPARGMYYLTRMPPVIVRRVRVETVAILAIFGGLFWTLQLSWLSVLVCYACFSFNWSTRQYITHAFSPREVIEGAFNLRHNWFMDWWLLHGTWDLNHHRHPGASWYYLPRLSPDDAPQRSYFWQYFRQWRGPSPVSQPAPQPVSDELLERWSAGNY